MVDMVERWLTKRKYWIVTMVNGLSTSIFLKLGAKSWIMTQTSHKDIYPLNGDGDWASLEQEIGRKMHLKEICVSPEASRCPRKSANTYSIGSHQVDP